MNKPYTILHLSKYFLTSILAVLFVAQEGNARHIIGGEMSYDCLGNDRYRFTMILYRDCNGNGAEFDSDMTGNFNATPGTVTIYRGNSNQVFRTIILDQPQITDLDLDLDNPCLVRPPNVCVEEGVYTFTLELPLSQESYHVSYQRCCRNNTIQNIIDPGSVGITMTMELTPFAQQECYDSPESVSYPPLALCLGEYIEEDLSATDPYNDTEIRYEFCAPLEGGGEAGSNGNPGNPTDANGVAPDPDTPPPYTPVSFRMPVYSAEMPLPGDPPIEIDPITGIISGTPNRIGQFVVGVCATQTKDGQVLSVLRREFQFNITECERRVYADLAGGDERSVDTIKYFSCGPRTINFNNESVDENFIESYDWEFEVGQDTRLFEERNPSITFPDTGRYYGKMVLNRGIDGCNDSIFLDINIRNEINAEFDVSLNSCDATDLVFNNESSSGNGDIVSTVWNTGDSIIRGEMELTDYVYDTAGIKNIVLTIEDEEGCTDSASQVLEYYPTPNIIDFDVLGNQNCTRSKLKFINQSSPYNNEYNVIWDLGDGRTTTEKDPTVIYNEPGVYDISLSMVSPIGCEFDTIFENALSINEKPLSLFRYTPENLSSLSMTADFINLSESADSYEWLFDDISSSTLTNPTFTFPDTGYYEVDLIALANNGCIDTSTQILDVVPITTYFLPNAFSPNSDGQNDLFFGKGFTQYMADFKMIIFDRWGRKQFETSDPMEGWNGTYMNSGRDATEGVYVVKVVYKGARSKNIELVRKFTLLR